MMADDESFPAMTTVPEPSAELLQGRCRPSGGGGVGADGQPTAGRRLQAMADALAERADAIVAANREDLEHSAAEGLAPALMARLCLMPPSWPVR